MYNSSFSNKVVVPWYSRFLYCAGDCLCNVFCADLSDSFLENAGVSILIGYWKKAVETQRISMRYRI